MHLLEKKSVNQLLLRCGFYGFALTQLNVMPSVHSGRFSKKYLYNPAQRTVHLGEKEINFKKIFFYFYQC